MWCVCVYGPLQEGQVVTEEETLSRGIAGQDRYTTRQLRADGMFNFNPVFYLHTQLLCQ